MCETKIVANTTYINNYLHIYKQLQWRGKRNEVKKKNVEYYLIIKMHKISKVYEKQIKAKYIF